MLFSHIYPASFPAQPAEENWDMHYVRGKDARGSKHLAAGMGGGGVTALTVVDMSHDN